MSSFVIYVVGFLIIIGALAYGATTLGVPAVWIGVGAALMFGVGLISAVTHTRRKDKTEASTDA